MTVDGSAPGEVEGGLDEPTELEPEQGTLELASPEDDHERADWERAAAAVLRKAGRLQDDDADELVWDRLARTTLDGIAVPPLGTLEHVTGLRTSGRPGRAGEWDVRSLLDLPDPDAAREAALVDLDNGATSLWVEVERPEHLRTVLDGVLLDLAPVVLDGGADQVARAEAFLALLGDTTPAPGTNLGGRIPTGRGGSGQDDATGGWGPTEQLVAVARLARDAGTLGVVVDAAEVHDRGASDVQELAWSLAAGAEHLRVLTGAGFTLGEALRLLEFRYAATDEQFPTIAKLRAARRLWARVVELCGDGAGAEGYQRQHVVTSRPMMTRYDPWVNMLRTTVAAFAAGVGGADAITVLPFDSALGVPDAFGRRIARNTSSLLVSESHLARVVDPAGGAYAVERLTDDLAVAAWAELGRIEAEGLAAFEQRVAEVARRREGEVATRARPITGVSEFPDLAEVLPERPAYPAQREVRRYAAAYEALRDDPADGAVFLATLGPVAAHTARATFATNLLAAGGIAVEAAGATAGPDDLLAAYAGQPVVCLAGTDAAYAEWGAEAAAALRGAGAARVLIAGRPTDYVDDAAAAGVDALAFLGRVREALR